MSLPSNPDLEWANLSRMLDEAGRQQRQLRALAARAVAARRVSADLIERLTRADGYAAELADRQLELLRRINEGHGKAGTPGQARDTDGE